jgi:hypothetical protein
MPSFRGSEAFYLVAERRHQESEMLLREKGSNLGTLERWQVFLGGENEPVKEKVIQ